MEPIKIEATEFTPKVEFNHIDNHFEVSGFSRPEDVRSFYQPIITWLEEFESKILQSREGERFTKDPMKFIFKLDYFNSASAKFLLDVLVVLNKFYINGFGVQIDWLYEDGDDEILESGEELNEMVDFEFNFVEIDSE